MEPEAKTPVAQASIAKRAQGLIEAGAFFFSRGWVPATSSNFSARLDDQTVLMTESGRHKGRLTPADFLCVDIGSCQSLEPGRRPSAEALLHTRIYQTFPEIGCVLHTHSKAATLLSRLAGEAVVLADYELLKALPGIDTHATALSLPVIDNAQHMPDLDHAITAHWAHGRATAGYLLRGHGLYTWGATIDDAVRHVEALEFMLDCELTLRSCP